MSTTAVWVWNGDPPAANRKPPIAAHLDVYRCARAAHVRNSNGSRGRFPSEKDENII